MKIIVIIFALVIVSVPCHSEVIEDFSAWSAIQGQGSFKPDSKDGSAWQWWMEGQSRFFDDAGHLGQSLIRPGIGYKTLDNLSFWLGYAWIYTDPIANRSTDEHRIWQQMIWNRTSDFGSLNSRTRLEQRFLNTGDTTGWRFRQFVKHTYPLYMDRLYSSVWNEVFVNINSTDWGAESGFAQNRFFLGLGAMLDNEKHYRIELGYLNQFINTPIGSDRVNHIISANLFIRY